jgi:hypothetical protein
MNTIWSEPGDGAANLWAMRIHPTWCIGRSSARFRSWPIFPGRKNTWAPEIYGDSAKSQWLIIWSSTVAGKQDGNRIYRSMTADWKTFSQPQVFFDPGYVAIDATILQTRGRYYLVFKDERLEPLHKWIKIADSASLEGPYSNVSEAFTESWSEGPSEGQVGSDYIVYYDHYRAPRRYEAVRSADLKHWTPINEEVTFPEGCKHGSFLKLTADEKQRLETAKAPGALSQSLPDIYHSEMYGDAPYLTEAGWRPLLNGRDLTGWHTGNQAPSDWFTTAAVEWKRIFSPTHLTAKPGPGTASSTARMVRLPT